MHFMRRWLASMKTLEIATPDGTCPTTLFGDGARPGVILVMDAGGPRDALFTIARDLAARGFSVAVPNLMYRAGSPFDLLGDLPRDTPTFFNAMRTDPVFRAALTEKFIRSANSPAHVERDFGALLSALAEHFAPGPVGLTGYCMGGGIALRVASLFPSKVRAVASFHGGHLATTAPDSPHLGLPSVQAEVFVAGAVEDGSFSSEMRDRLVAALEAAKVKNRVETWQGKHGFAVPDFPVFDQALYAAHLDVLAELLTRSAS